MALACGRTRFDGTSLCVAGRSGRGDANRHARESRARSTSESARRSLEGAGGFALASRCIGERHARHALPACTSTPTDQHAHGGGAGKSPKGFRPAGRRSLKRQVRAPIKKRRGVGATITSHALHSCAPAPFTAELLPPQMLYVHLYFGPSRVCAALRAVFAAVFEASNTAANTARSAAHTREGPKYKCTYNIWGGSSSAVKGAGAHECNAWDVMVAPTPRRFLIGARTCLFRERRPAGRKPLGDFPAPPP